MSWEATSSVVNKSKQKGSAYLLILLLANHADGNGYSWYGVRRLALETRLKERNVRYLIRKLERSGELEVFIGKGENGTNLYRVTCVADKSEHPGKDCSPAKIAPRQGAGASPGKPALQPPAIAVAAKSKGSIKQSHGAEGSKTEGAESERRLNPRVGELMKGLVARMDKRARAGV
jgi:helix-turn-helix protein